MKRFGSQTGEDARTHASPGALSLGCLLAPSLAVVLVLFGGGLVFGMVQALGYMPGAGLTQWSSAHFIKVLSDPDFLHSFLLTLYVAGVSTVIAALISIPSALALAALGPSARVVQVIFQVPLAVPHLVIAMAVIFLLAPAGLLVRAAMAAGWIEEAAGFPLLVNDRAGVGIICVYVWKEIPFISLMILAVLRQGGQDLLDVGRTLKAGPWQRFRYITLPTIFPALGAASLIVFAYTFGAFEVPYLLGRTYPMTLPVSAYRLYSDIDLLARPEGIATGLVIALVVVLTVVSAQGLTRATRRRGKIL